jgi:hypothetical protein
MALVIRLKYAQQSRHGGLVEAFSRFDFLAMKADDTERRSCHQLRALPAFRYLDFVIQN